MSFRGVYVAIVATSLIAPSLAAGAATLAGRPAVLPASGISRGPQPTVQRAGLGPANRSVTKGFKVLYTFSGFAPYGRILVGGVTVDKKGNIFGTTEYAPFSTSGDGTLWELQPKSSQYAESNIAVFDGSNGAQPTDRPIEDAAGNLYVTTSYGVGSTPYGTVNEYSPTASGWTQSAITFLGAGSAGGKYPYASPTEQNGTIYVPTSLGGAHAQGAIYALNPAKLTGSTIYSFGGPDLGDLEEPYATLVPGPGGVLYGTALGGGGGFGSQGGGGGVYSLTGGSYKLLFQFQVNSSNNEFEQGYASKAPVVVDKDGNIYGTAALGGSYAAGTCQSFGCGTVFKLTKSGSSYIISVLHTFTAGTDGYQPTMGLVLKGKTLYGTTYVGGTAGCGPGSFGCGTIFKIKTSGKGYKILHRFVGTDGGNPIYGSLELAGKTLYGSTETAYGQGSLVEGGVVFSYTI